jgi:hypothetical protein
VSLAVALLVGMLAQLIHYSLTECRTTSLLYADEHNLATDSVGPVPARVIEMQRLLNRAQ